MSQDRDDNVPTPAAPRIRLYREDDRAAMFDICMRTAEAGGDARQLYDDQELMPDIFAAPYAHLEPHLAFVLDDGARAVGYILGTSDTARFVRQFRERWLPLVAERHPAPTGEPATRDEQMAALLHWPERMIVPELADYPAHLHIDLLPDYQGRGYGRLLAYTLFDALAAAGAPRVHLSMLTANTSARAFYDRIGFRELTVADPGPLTFLGRETALTDAERARLG
ncbi:GNAT family N-acetyltransferase [Actinocrinis puniceicyclus]|uniref:GNAT family N-acetyltransferase n=1 Tax=Actinocrinis puniceicyclus TaxID=977794 RepID=A0A8J8BAP8_9ACTN|nr:GNAT family N-acetyltransferase [Actinocrinis puniceicyclus]MBS2963187.1 GNAT family N-acetyltransferase [Actinocrinis puniceicyclus]